MALLRTGGNEPAPGAADDKNGRLPEAATPTTNPASDQPAAEVAQTTNITTPTDAAAQDTVVAIVEPPQPEAEPVRTTSEFATVHTVEHRDTLFQIAKAHDLSVEELARVNGMSKDDTLRTGETLFIPHCDGKVVKVNNGDSLWDLCQRYKVRMAQALEANAMEDPTRLQAGKKVFLPGAKEPVRPAPEFKWPLEGRFTSGFGWRKHPMGGGEYSFHYGIDIAAPRGTDISATKDGVVTYAGWRGALGRTIILSHAGGYTTRYGHMARLLVKRGERVRQGEVIGTVGSTGNSTGPHCHFEVHRNGRAVDPMSVLAKQPTASR